jgi:iron complex outermembrane recepter protein
MKARKAVVFVIILGFLIVFSGVSPIKAQESAKDEFTLEEITVTAQKRVENQQKVPIAMDAISGEDLALSGKTDVNDILRDLSNVSIYTASDGMRVSIRGVTDNGSNYSGVKTSTSMVGINIDGVQNNMGNAGQNLFDVERVEVLYGPQSTLYGSNSPGGIVNVVTASPKTDRYYASASANYGSFKSLSLQGAVNVPVIKDKVAMRLAVSRSKQDSVLSGSSGRENTAARLKVMWQPNDDLSITMTPLWSRDTSGGMMGDSVKTFDRQNGNWWTASTTGGGPDAVTTWVNEGKVTDPWTKVITQAGGPGAPPGGGNANASTTKGLSSDINWKTFLGTFSFVPSYSKSSSGGTMTDNNNYVYDTTNYTKQTGAELRSTNPEDFTLFTWVVGATYNKSEQGMDSIPRDPTVSSQDNYMISKKKALYANITYPFWFYSKLALTLGYRQSWDNMISQFFGGPMGDVEGAPNNSSFSKPDMKFGFNWDAEDNLMIYGSYASSYRGVNAQANSEQANNPETLKSYTLGAKSRVLDNKLQLNGSVYYYKYHNKYDQTEQESAYVDYATWVKVYPTIKESTTSPGYSYLTSRGWPVSGDFKSLGADFSTSWIITSLDRLNLSVSYLDAKWKSLTKPASQDYPLIFPAKSYKNLTAFNSPKWSLTAGYEHNFDLWSWGTLTPSMDAQYKTSTWLTFSGADGDPYGIGFQENYYLLNGSATFNHASGVWSANFSVKNIMNYAVKQSYFTQGGGSLRIGDPRTYQIGVNIKF